MPTTTNVSKKNRLAAAAALRQTRIEKGTKKRQIDRRPVAHTKATQTRRTPTLAIGADVLQFTDPLEIFTPPTKRIFEEDILDVMLEWEAIHKTAVNAARAAKVTPSHWYNLKADLRKRIAEGKRGKLPGPKTLRGIGMRRGAYFESLAVVSKRR